MVTCIDRDRDVRNCSRNMFLFSIVKASGETESTDDGEIVLSVGRGFCIKLSGR